jgi:hypothetical protein
MVFKLLLVMMLVNVYCDGKLNQHHECNANIRFDPGWNMVCLSDFLFCQGCD